MIWQIVKKQALIFLRNKQQLILLLVFPVLLITILSTALAGVMGEDDSTLEIDVVMVEHESEKDQIKAWMEENDAVNLPEEMISSLFIIERLKEDVFGSIADVTVTEIVPEEKKEVVKQEDFAVLIDVPENFTKQMLDVMWKETGTAPTLQFLKNTDRPMSADVVEEIMNQYQEQLLMRTFARSYEIDLKEMNRITESITSTTTTIDHMKEVSAKEYYTIGMAVMNVLFIASTIGVYAFQEKKSNVYNRMIVANISPWIYFSGIFISAFVFSFMQLIFIFTMAWIFFGVTWSHITGFLVITIALAAAVAGTAVLLTSISFRVNSMAIMSFFSSIIVSVSAFFGGSYLPVKEASKFIEWVGNVTPNGASMSAYLKLLQGEGVSELGTYILYLCGYACVLIVIAGLTFPKRGEIQ